MWGASKVWTVKKPDIENYNKEWINWIKKNDQFITRCFSTITFGATGFNDNISSENEIHKYGGGIHFLNTKELKEILGGVDEEELELLTNTVGKISKVDKEYKEKYYKDCENEVSSIVCIPSLMRALVQLRILKTLKQSTNSNEFIVDIGPGSGYFALLAALSGYKILATDISSGYFCFQKFLYENILDQQYKMADGLTEISSDTKLLHVPVWQWTNRNFKIPDNTSLIIANHVLNEMHRHSLIYLLELIEDSSCRNPQFAIEGWGYGSRTNPQLLQQTQKLFRLYGYKVRASLKSNKLHNIDILEKATKKRIENIDMMTNRTTEPLKILDNEILESITDRSGDLPMDNIRNPTGKLKIYSVEETFKILVGKFNDQSQYLRLDQEFLEKIGVASDHNRMFFHGLEKGEYI